MEKKDMYELRELYDKLNIPLAELGRRAKISEVTIAKIRDGHSARRSTINALLETFAEIYSLDNLSIDTVKGIVINDKLARRAREQAPSPSVLPEPIDDKSQSAKPQNRSVEQKKRTYTRKKDLGLPEGCILAIDFARTHGIAPTTFYDHILVGLGRGEKEKIEAEERDKPGRKGERERYLTPAQQTAALDFWRRHGVPFTMPETEQETVGDEPAWYMPEQEG